MSESIRGKVAIVTGASSGIGEATALALAEEGARVVLTARRQERLEALAGRIRDAGGEAEVAAADVSDEGQARGVIEQATRTFGGVDLLINNAGTYLDGDRDFEDLPLSVVERTFLVNSVAPMRMARAPFRSGRD